MTAKPLLLLLLLGLLAACASGAARQDQFRQQLFAYEQAVRWGEMAVANRFQPPALQLDEPALARYAGIRVTGYETEAVKFLDDQRRAEVRAKISYYHDTEQRVRAVTDLQEWRYDDEARQWLLFSGLPDLR